MDPSRGDESSLFSCRYYVTISLSFKNEKKKRKKGRKRGSKGMKRNTCFDRAVISSKLSCSNTNPSELLHFQRSIRGVE